MRSRPSLAFVLTAIGSLTLGCLTLREWARYRDLTAIADVKVASPMAVREADLVYFYSPACQLCRRATLGVIRAARANPDLQVVYFNVATGDFYEVRDRLNQQFGVPLERASEIPALFSRRRGLVGSEAILRHLPDEVHSRAADANPIRRGRPSIDTLEQATGRLRLWPVAAAALLDSINPCAISTALFLIAYLACAGRSRAQLALTGLLYCLGVVSCYSLVGMGVLRGLYGLTGFGAAALALNLMAGAATSALAIINVRQYLLLRRGRLRNVDMGLPQAARLTTHSVIRRLVTRPTVFAGAAFVTGVTVSAVELPCTGQIYLPTIVYLAGRPDQRVMALQFLMFYNVIFVGPLIALFALAVTVRSLRGIQDFVRQNVPFTRLANALCFLAMTALFWRRLIG